MYVVCNYNSLMVTVPTPPGTPQKLPIRLRHYLIQSSQQPYEVGIMMNPICHMWRLRLREANYLLKGMCLPSDRARMEPGQCRALTPQKGYPPSPLAGSFSTPQAPVMCLFI